MMSFLNKFTCKYKKNLKNNKSKIFLKYWFYIANYLSICNLWPPRFPNRMNEKNQLNTILWPSHTFYLIKLMWNTKKGRKYNKTLKNKCICKEKWIN